ncbi:MAG: YciI family protein [Bacillota bacterium]|nr:YciI family protein [Bacillota bacterium]
MQYIITAYDTADADALDRRMRVRPRHLENMQKVMEENRVLCAGGITNEAGAPVGSFLLLEFPPREELDRYLETEPYLTDKVWEKIRVEPCSAVILDNRMGL